MPQGLSPYEREDFRRVAGETLPAEQLLPGFLTTPENAPEFVANHP